MLNFTGVSTFLWFLLYKLKGLYWYSWISAENELTLGKHRTLKDDMSTFKDDMSYLMTKTIEWHVRPAKTQISLGIRLDWSESSLSALRKLGSLATHWVHSEDSDQTGRMPRLIWLFVGHMLILLVLSCPGSVMFLLPHGNCCFIKQLRESK